MKAARFVVLPLVLAVGLTAQNIQLRATGTVSSTTITAGPYAGASAGDPAVFELEVATPGTVLSPGSYENYSIVRSANIVDGASASLMRPAFIGIQNDFPVADGIHLFRTRMDATGYWLEFECFGNGGAFFDSTDLFRLGGSYDASLFQLVDWNIFTGSGSMNIRFEAVTVFPKMTADTPTVSTSAGGSQVLSIDAGTLQAGRVYVVIGSATGTGTGIPFGHLLFPLNLDSYTTLTLSSPNQVPLVNSFGALDGNGRAAMQFTLPAGSPAGIAGLVLHHAAVVLDPGAVTHVSNPVELTIDS